MEKDIYEKAWSGKHGDEYVKRCNVDPESRVPIFDKLISDLIKVELFDVLECGCNKGHNLYAIHDVLESNNKALDDEGYMTVIHSQTGLEINKSLCKSKDIVNGSIYDIPWNDNAFDFVFTSGVLIHIPKDRLNTAMSEMRRVSKEYVMMIEYYEKEEVGTKYGEDFNNQEGVWSRPYGDIYRETFPDDALIKSGKISDLGDDGWGFSKCNYWIYKKG